MTYSIAQFNQMNQSAFVEALGFVFEDTPTIAAQTWHDRPFSSATDLHQKMLAVMHSMSTDQQIALIKAHPDLGSRVKMADASVKEQSSVGLDQLAPDEYERFRSLNEAYKTKFDFPFIIAVKAQTKTSILEAFDRRLQNTFDLEMQQALSEIGKIAGFRIADLVESEERGVRE